MLKRTAIRALCNTTAYQRGLDIYRTGKRIQSLDIKSEGAVDKISAAVKGSGRNVYNTGFQYDTEADRIKEAYCDCPAFRSYSGIVSIAWQCFWNMETVRPMSVWKSADSRMRNRSRQSHSAEQHFRLLYPDQGSLQRKPPLS